MKVPQYLNLYKPKINDSIKKIYVNKLNEVRNPFLREYYNELMDYFLVGGKRLRPLVCIATYNAFSSERDDKIVFPSVGVEFLHNASLIHDDIIDKDDFRRNNPAFHYRFKQYHSRFNLKKMNKEDFGNSIGILGGDSAFFFGLEAFFNNGFDLDQNIRAIKYYERVFQEICDGVLIELDMVNQEFLKMQDYIEMISLKTGALIEKSMLIGANYARVEDKYLQNISKYAINLGIIFQMIDDILGTFGDEKITGKPTNGDIREGKKTCLLIDALEKLDSIKRERILGLIGNPNIKDEEVQEVKDLFLEAEAVFSCKNLVNDYTKIAKIQLDELIPNINQSEAEFFENLLKYVVERNF